MNLTKIGRGVHMTSSHPKRANDDIVTKRKKARWSQEELRLLASEEATAKGRGVGVSAINQYLVGLESGRTLHAIKKVRQRAEYRELVLAALSGGPPTRTGTCSLDADNRTLTAAYSNLLPTCSDSLVVASGSGGPDYNTDPSTPAHAGAEAVRLLSSVTGHGVQRLLTAAKRMVDLGECPSDAITVWSREYIKGCGTTLKPSSWQSGAAGPDTGRPKSRPNRKALNAAEYRKNVAMWKRRKGTVAEKVLKGVDSRADGPGFDTMFKYWAPIIEGSNSAQFPSTYQCHTRYRDVLLPISTSEVLSALPSSKTAPGPDGFRARLWRRLPIALLAGLFNLLLASGEIPGSFLGSRTIFVPKKGDASCPGNYRPISIASVALRHYHRILAVRLERLRLVDIRQRAFRRADGVAENVFLLDSLLREARSGCKGLCVASLDLSKAFDSVSHSAIKVAMERVGLEPRFVDYIAHIYDQASTFIQVGKQCSRPLKVSKGVRQGDPLSPLLFNLVIDLGLEALPEDVGFQVGEARVNALAFADDVVLVAETPAGLQKAIDRFCARLEETGMGLNPAKCVTLSLVPSGRDRKVKTVDVRYSFGGSALPTLGVSDLWRYLGLEFVGGRLADSTGATYPSLLDHITSAPMKPQMRLAIARDFLLPKLVHGLVFGNVSAGRLKSLDYHSRRAVRQWLRLPASCPNSYIHAPTSAGGLGIVELRSFIPSLRVRRLEKLGNSDVLAVREAFRIHGSKVLATARRQVARNNTRPSWCEQLHKSVDGRELEMAPGESASVEWLRRPDGIPGSDFRRYCQLRINALPSRKRVQRGRQGPTSCRACGVPSETLAHIVQNCPRTNGGRIYRHDHVVKKTAALLTDKGFEVETEFTYKLANGNLKPDIVATKSDGDGRRASVILDVQVVSGNSMGLWHATKVRKYASRTDLINAVRARKRSTDVQTVAATLSWRGVWEPTSSRSLRALGASTGFLSSIATRVMRGSLMNWTTFNTSTCTFKRIGVG
uniref:Retrovirus-related Pol polyprotein from type-1 retrotransposable element R2 n=1 Tax=Sipha flava TaxID=143950 RepID=A0A2S2Q7J7_9HEMI